MIINHRNNQRQDCFDDPSMMINISWGGFGLLLVFVDNGTVVVDVEILGFCGETSGMDVVDEIADDGRGGGVGAESGAG